MNQKERELILVSSIVGAIAGFTFKDSYFFYNNLVPEWLSLIITLFLLVIILYIVLVLLEKIIIPLIKRIFNPKKRK